jgi:ribosomal protein S18 acetylase RimI-like enzyme
MHGPQGRDATSVQKTGDSPTSPDRSIGDAVVEEWPVVELGSERCKVLADTLGDSPETVISAHLLRRLQCSAYAVGPLARPDAAVIRPIRLTEELNAHGEKAQSIWRVLQHLSGWTCVNVNRTVALRLGAIIESELHRPVRYLDDLYFTPGRRAPSASYPAVRTLNMGDACLLSKSATKLAEIALGFGTFESLLAEGVAAGAIVEGRIVALACTTAQTPRHADLGVATLEDWRGQGLATACAAHAAAGILRAGRTLVWSVGESNSASVRVAEKLGFAEVGRRTYVVLDGNTSSA